MRRSFISELLPPWSPRIRPYPPGKPLEEVERELGRSAIKLASNENPLGPSPKALEAIGRALHKVHLYPDGQGYYLRRKLAECHGLDMSQIVLGAGSTDLIELVGKTFLTAGDEGITSESAFYIYRLAIEEMGAGLVLTPLRDMTFDLAAIFKSAHNSPEIDHRACITMILRWRPKRRFSQQNFANQICHTLECSFH